MDKRILSVIKHAAIVASLVLITVPPVALGQGRGRGRGNNQNWKCGVFVNCHDARDGRVDGRGRHRTNGAWRNGVFVPRGSNVGYRRYNTSDYWRRRHLSNGTRTNRVWRNR